MIKFLRLEDLQETIPIITRWAENEWGYIRNMGIEYRENIFREFIKEENTCLPICYVAVIDGSYNNSTKRPVGMFVLEESKGEFLERQSAVELTYVYVDSPFRYRGIGALIVQKAVEVVRGYAKNIIVFETLRPSLNRFYERLGAKRIRGDWDDVKLFNEPVTKYYMNVNYFDQALTVRSTEI